MYSISGELQIGDTGGHRGDSPVSARWVASSESGRIQAALHGRVRWTDASLERLSRDTTPAQALLAAYENYDDRFLDLIAGKFALAIVDQSKQVALLAIDRFGIEQLYWHDGGCGEVIFASTATGVLEKLPDCPVIDDQSIFNFLYFHCVPAPATMWCGVHKLEPGHVLRVTPASASATLYWTPDFARPNRRSLTVLNDDLRASLTDAVNWASSGASVGAFLSGGLDSSTICGLMQESSEDPVPAYSVGFVNEEYNELQYARLAAARFGFEHHEIIATTDDAVECLERIFAAFDEPFGNSSILPTYVCARAAADSGIETLVAGDGGDELFAGNERYVKQKIFEMYGVIPSAIRNYVIQPSLLKTLAGVDFRPVRKTRRYVEQAVIPLPRRLETFNYLENWELAFIFTPDFLQRVDAEAPSALLKTRFDEARNADFLDRMLYLDWKFTLADNDLRKVTTMCNLAGVDVQFPFLDERVVQTSIEVASTQKIRRFALRHFYKQAMQGFLPEEIINKPKHGFGLPFGEWLKTSPLLQREIYDRLSGLSGRGVIRPDFVETLVEQHKSGHAAYYGTAIWVFLALEMWFRREDGKSG